MRLYYYAFYPRDYANEYVIYAVATEDRKAFLEWRKGAVRIKKEEAVDMAFVRPLNKTGPECFGGPVRGVGGEYDDCCNHKERLAKLAKVTKYVLESEGVIG